MKCVCVCVCVEGVEERPIYSSRGQFLSNARMEADQVPWQLLLLEVHLARARPGSSDSGVQPTLGGAPPGVCSSGRLIDGPRSIFSRASFVVRSPIFSARWALLVSM